MIKFIRVILALVAIVMIAAASDAAFFWPRNFDRHQTGHQLEGPTLIDRETLRELLREIFPVRDERRA